MEQDPLSQLTVIYESRGFTGKEAVEKAEIELERRRKRELELKQAGGKNHHLLSFVPASVSQLLFLYIVPSHSLLSHFMTHLTNNAWFRFLTASVGQPAPAQTSKLFLYGFCTIDFKVVVLKTWLMLR